MKETTLLDTLINELDCALTSLWGSANKANAWPDPDADEQAAETALSPEQMRHSAALMRINMAGELAAQGLYRGQALVARNQETKEFLLQAAQEERQHLAWCRQRIDELADAPSLFNPLWYSGSLAIGILAGVSGDKWSLGFVAETERQVERHLSEHMQQLADHDDRSHHILQKMREDETQHGQAAQDAGGQELPDAVRSAMSFSAQVMKWVAKKL
ncbi:MAG: 2-polyprenyl-3-methyl-6-methoxy-1,4-benzoquinone monooxygenase [Gammaproteobacteria bacterium]